MSGSTEPAPDPAEVGTRWLHAMRAGDWEAAWQQTDRLEHPRRQRQGDPMFRIEPHHLRWDGTPFDGRTVLVRCLHGLGDTLQFMRFVPLVAARARALHFLIQPSLLELLHGAPGLGLVSNAWTDDPPPHEVEIEVMELAYALRCTAGAVPPPYPHLAQRVAGRVPLPPARDLRVGLLWAASDWDRSRSLALEQLGAVLRVPGVCVYSLQQGAAAESIDARLVPLHRHTGGIADAADAMRQLDLVIAVDGMPAHLAATLGTPTWLLLKQDADWRWQDSGTSTPWYPSMRLFRQARAGDWEPVVRDVAAALEALASRRQGQACS